MLRFTRGIHTSRCLLQEAQVLATESTGKPDVFAESKEKVDSFLRYWKNNRTMKILMYRRKHVQELLARDLIDKHTDERAKPLPPPQIPSKRHFANVIKNSEKAEDIKQHQDDLALLAKKAHCVGAYHINELIIKAAEFARSQNVLVFIYGSKLGRKMSDTSTTNIIFTLLYLNKNKSFLNSMSKVKNIRRQMPKKQDTITDLLECAIYSKYNQTVVKQELYERVKTDKLELPLAEFEKSIGHQANLYNEAEHLYITLKPIDLELVGSKNFGQLENVKLVHEFVTKYEQLAAKLGKPNRFEEVKSKSKFFALNRGAGKEEGAEQAEEVKEE